MSLIKTISKIATKVIEFDGLTDALADGKIPPELLSDLDRETASYKKLAEQLNERIAWSNDDYAVSVNTIIGEASIEETLKEWETISRLISDRDNELREAIESYDEISERTLQALEADYGVTDAKGVLEDLYDTQGTHAIDSTLGSNQLGMAIIELDQELLPRLSARANELERIQELLGRRVEDMTNHLHDAHPIVDELHKHFERVIEIKENEALSGAINSLDSDQLEAVSAATSRVAAARSRIVEGNKLTRQRVRDIQSAQAAAAKKVRDLNSAFAIIQLGLAIAGVAASVSESGGADIQSIDVSPKQPTSTAPRKLKAPIKKPVQPRRNFLKPQKPLKLKSMG